MRDTPRLLLGQTVNSYRTRCCGNDSRNDVSDFCGSGRLPGSRAVHHVHPPISAETRRAIDSVPEYATTSLPCNRDRRAFCARCSAHIPRRISREDCDDSLGGHPISVTSQSSWISWRDRRRPGGHLSLLDAAQYDGVFAFPILAARILLRCRWPTQFLSRKKDGGWRLQTAA